jgi:hypothetical protein
MKFVELILGYLLSWKFIGPTVAYTLFIELNAFFGMRAEEKQADTRYREVLQDAREKLRQETAVLQAMGDGSSG